MDFVWGSAFDLLKPLVAAIAHASSKPPSIVN